MTDDDDRGDDNEYNDDNSDDDDDSFHCFCFSAEAYQSIVLLMGKQQMYAHFHGRAKIQHLEQWSEDEASQVLEAWKREFTKVKIAAILIFIPIKSLDQLFLC